MAFPVVESVLETATTSAATTIAILPPSGLAVGDLMVAWVASNGSNNTHTWPSANGTWTELVDPNVQPNLSIAWKVATSGDLTTPGNVTLSNSSKAAMAVYRISGHDVPTTSPTLGTAGTGTSNTPNPGNCNPGTAKDYLWLTGFSQAGEALDDDAWLNNAATNYTNPVGVTTGTGGAATSNAQLGVSQRNLNAASEDAAWPAATSDLATAWRAYTVAIPPAPSGNAWTANPADSTSLSDSLTSFGIGPGVNDSTSLSDAQSKQETKFLVPTDSTTPTDAQAFDRTQSLADTETPTDSTTSERGLATAPADTTTPTDGQSFQSGKEIVPADTTTPTDSLTSFGLGQGLADSVTPADARAFGMGPGVNDYISFVNYLANPSGEVNANYWTSHGGGTATRTSAWSADGGWSIERTPDVGGASSTWGTYPQFPGGVTYYVPTVGGDQWFATVDVQVLAQAGNGLHLSMEWKSISGGALGSTSGAYKTDLGVATLTLQGTAPTNAAWVVLSLYFDNVLGLSPQFRFDKAMLVKSPDPVAYFDGSYPNAAWNGTAHGSFSLATVADAQALGVGKAASDTSTPTDSATTEAGKAVSPSDSTTPTDAQSFGYGEGVIDTETPTDAQSFDRGQGVADTETPTDNATTSSSVNVDDSETPTDAQSFGRGVTAADTETPSDALSFDRAQSVADSTSLADSQVFVVGFDRAVGDSTAVSDAAQAVRDLAQAIADSQTLSDAISTVEGYNLSPADSTALSDALVTAQGYARSLADSLTTSDSLYFDRQQLVADVVTLVDQQSMGVGLSQIDTLILSDSTATTKEIAAEIADAIGVTDNVVAFLPGQGAPYVHTQMPQGGLLLNNPSSGGTFVIQIAGGGVIVYEASGIVTASWSEGDQE